MAILTQTEHERHEEHKAYHSISQINFLFQNSQTIFSYVAQLELWHYWDGEAGRVGNLEIRFAWKWSFWQIPDDWYRFLTLQIASTKKRATPPNTILFSTSFEGILTPLWTSIVFIYWTAKLWIND